MSLELPSFVGLAEPGTCSVEAPRKTGSNADLSAHLRKRVIEFGDPSGERIVSLNGRGANYGLQRDPMAGLALLQVEAERQAAETR